MGAQNRTDWTPTPKQAAVLEAAAESGVGRSISRVAEAAGVRRATVYDWMRDDPDFKRAWEAVWYGSIRRHLPGVVAAMVAQAQTGDVQAARLVADMAGVLKQRHELTGEDGAALGVVLLPAKSTDGAEGASDDA